MPLCQTLPMHRQERRPFGAQPRVQGPRRARRSQPRSPTALFRHQVLPRLLRLRRHRASRRQCGNAGRLALAYRPQGVGRNAAQKPRPLDHARRRVRAKLAREGRKQTA